MAKNYYRGERPNPKKKRNEELDDCKTVADLKEFIKKNL